MYRGGTDENLMNIIGLPRAAFDYRLSVLSCHYVISLVQGHPGRPAPLIHKNVVLALLLHYYESTMDIKIFVSFLDPHYRLLNA